MTVFRIKDKEEIDLTPIFSLRNDCGDLSLVASFADGREEILLYIDEYGVNRRYLSDDIIIERLEKAGFPLEGDRIKDYR